MFKYVAEFSAPSLQFGKTMKKPVMKIAARHALATSIIVETEVNTEWKKVATVSTNKKVMKRKNEIMVCPLFYLHYYRNMSSPLTTHHSSPFTCNNSLPRR